MEHRLTTNEHERLARDVGESLLRIAYELDEMFRRASAPEGLAPIDARLLAIAAEHPQLGLSAFATRLGCDAPRVTDIANRLQRRGLLRRVVSRSDRRVRHLQVTEAGRASLDRVGARLIADSPLMALSESQLTDLARALALVDPQQH